MTEKEAYKKAIKLADLLGIQTVTEHKDGTLTTKRRTVTSDTIDIEDIINVIME